MNIVTHQHDPSGMGECYACRDLLCIECCDDHFYGDCPFAEQLKAHERNQREELTHLMHQRKGRTRGAGAYDN
jgi:hypothetical protein